MTTNNCDLCNQESSVHHLRGRCHITAPLRAEIDSQGILTLYCYVPECNRVVAQFRVQSVRAVEVTVESYCDPIYLGM